MVNDQPSQRNVVIKNPVKNYDALDAEATIKAFCAFIRNVIAHYDENKRIQEAAEARESDLRHCMEMTEDLTGEEKAQLFDLLTEALQTRRTCKVENEILKPIYDQVVDKNLILKAKEHNWGLIGPGTWERHSWKINDDGWYEYKESYRSGSGDIPEIPTLIEEGVLSSQKLTQLKELLVTDWTDEKADACDGTAWEFKMYEGGTVVKQREIGYIYDIEPFESIAKLLTEE